MSGIEHEVRLRIIKYLLNHKRASYTQLARALNTSPSNILHHAKKLQSMGVLVEVRQGEYKLRSVPVRPSTVFLLFASLGFALYVVFSRVMFGLALLVLLCSYVFCMLCLGYWCWLEYRDLPHVILARVTKKKEV